MAPRSLRVGKKTKRSHSQGQGWRFHVQLQHHQPDATKRVPTYIQRVICKVGMQGRNTWIWVTQRYGCNKRVRLSSILCTSKNANK
ncbi:hypothetical protein TRIATDRAFT_301108 [Trichoderma atroviride IMI 206040]|uniref:Uncharacterized protein n=1 Tax=Hypocrea atroviridis (strain ATCC 20476 / IMI 206040) TaxID=452589 RepID=G9P0Q1_HYPAI|nr:uncharacterized protein TRIATDRAFT_301108 [Trichoderma atroviride IMI 206040]EHK43202.1 hypothetical protein TRIATDRAFT_301108 [Trichoderma atroviride IMI 206040]